MTDKSNASPFGPSVIMNFTEYQQRAGKTFSMQQYLKEFENATPEMTKAVLSNCTTRIILKKPGGL